MAGSSKSFFDLRQRTLSGMDLMPAFRVVVLGLARKLKNNTKDGGPKRIRLDDDKCERSNSLWMLMTSYDRNGYGHDIARPC